jgi:hypothetical protein
MNKIERALHGPSWTEVFFGAFLSLVLGVALGALLLLLRPAIQVKTLPKPEDRPRGAVYYMEGSRDATRGREGMAKLRAFVDGKSVAVTEDEVNAVLIAATKSGPGGAAKAGEKKPVEKKVAGKDAKSLEFTKIEETLAVGTPNVRIREGVMQVAAPVTVNLFGITEKLIVQARGGFVKQGDMFVFEPAQIFLNSCAVERIPVVAAYMRSKLLAAHPIPEDLLAAWRKLTTVAIDDNTLRLSP